MSEPDASATLEESRAAAERPGADERPQGLARGSAVGRYLVVAQVGSGAMGLVYAAYDPELDRKVALKLVRPRGRSLRRARERMQREAQVLAKLGHPNVVAVYDVGVHEEQLFIAMEFVEGQTLSEWMAAAPTVSTGGLSRGGASPRPPVRARPWREVLEVFVQAGHGLAAAHEAGFVHRDFKPDNVMLSEDGRVRVMDFGLVRVDDEPSDAASPSEEVGSLTRTGTMIGTPAYMPLEQFGGGSVDARSDQFSFCVALYEALYGERPFEGDTVRELMSAVLQGVTHAPARGAAVPGWVRAVVLRGLSVKPSDRFPSMHALLDALAADPVARRRRIATGLALGLALVAGGWGVLSLSDEVEQRDAVIEEQAGELERKNAELEAQLAAQTRLLSAQRGLRAKALVGTENEAEALLLGVQAVGAYAGAWEQAPREAVEGLEQVLAHDTINLAASHVLAGHRNYLTGAAYSPDGARLATSSYDGTVRLWELARAEPVATLDGHGGQPVLHVAYSPDGTRLATASVDATAKIWDALTGEPLVTLVGHEALVHTVVFSPDGTQVATAGRERSVRAWDAGSGALLLTLAADDEDMVKDLAYTPDGTRLVTAGSDATARVWDAKTGDRLATLTGHAGSIGALAIAPDGTRVATASVDRSARVWELATGTLVATLDGHLERVSEVAFSPDGQRVATVSWDGTGRIYDAASGKLRATLEGGHGAGIASLAYSLDGSSLATGSFGGNVAVWDAATGKLRARPRGHRADVWSLAFAPDGRQLATASVDQTARLWDLGGDRVAALEGPETDVRRFTYSPDGSQLATVSTDGRVRLWSTATGEPLRTLFEDPADAWLILAYRPDGRELAVASDRRLRVFDAPSGALRATLELRSPEPVVAYSPAGTLLYANDGGVTPIFDAGTHEALAILEHDRNDPRYAFAHDDSRVATGTTKGTVEVLDPRAGTHLATLAIPERSILLVGFSPDGQDIVTFGKDTGLRVWDAQSLTPRLTLPSPSEVVSLAYSPDGSRLAGGSGPGGVWIWDSRSGEVLLRIEPGAQETGTGYASFTRDGRRLVVIGSGTGFLRVHDAATGDPLVYIERVLAGHYELWSEGKRLTTMSSKHALEVWDVETGEPLTRERIGLVQADGAIAWPIHPRELTRIGCVRLRVFERILPEARDVCESLVRE